MKYCIFVLAFIGGCYYPPHSSYRMDMRVQSLVDTTFLCVDRIRVDWEIYGDTIRFDFGDTHLELLPCDYKRMSNKMVDYLNRLKLPDNEKIMIRVDDEGTLYAVHMVYKDGLLIYVTAIDQPQPHYSMCFYKSCVCE